MVDQDLVIGWLDLSYLSTGLFSRKWKPILVSLNGRINFHTLTALMGPSGAGKTTLLKCINMRNNEGLTRDTKIFVNKLAPLKTCFITQNTNDHLLIGLTVRESLLFASKLINRNVSQGSEQTDPNGQFDHKHNVDQILTELLLEDCADNQIKNCSGGERKRLAIAQELVAQLKPNLLCIDEPTSGLDSNASEVVIQCLRQLSDRHQMSIVTSIHQPNSLLLNMFDQLYVLSKGGHCVFSGRPDSLRQYLSDNAITCPEEVLPIELLLKISSKFPKSNNASEIETIEQVDTDSDRDTDEVDRLVNSMRQKSSLVYQEFIERGKLVSKSISKGGHGFNLCHFYHLLSRGFACFMRYQWKESAIQLFYSVSMVLLILIMCGTDVGKDDGCVDMSSDEDILRRIVELRGGKSSVTLNQNYLMIVVWIVVFQSVFHSIISIPQEIRVFVNEQHNQWYSTASYLWSKFLVQIVIAIPYWIIFASITYYASGQTPSTWRFTLYTLLVLTGMLGSASLGYFFSILFSHNTQIMTMTALVVCMLMSFLSGCLVPISYTDAVIQFVSNGSQHRLIFESLVIVIYGLERCSPPKESLVFRQLKLNDDKLVTKVWLMIANILFWQMMAMIALILKANDFSLTKIATKIRRKPKLIF